VKTGLHDGLRQPQREGVAPDTGPMTGSIHYQQPSTIRGEAHSAYDATFAANRDLPIPASPTMNAAPPDFTHARSTTPRSTASSRSLPTNGETDAPADTPQVVDPVSPDIKRSLAPIPSP
jgi:hypothetical protein